MLPLGWQKNAEIRSATGSRLCRHTAHLIVKNINTSIRNPWQIGSGRPSDDDDDDDDDLANDPVMIQKMGGGCDHLCPIPGYPVPVL